MVTKTVARLIAFYFHNDDYLERNAMSALHLHLLHLRGLYEMILRDKA